MWDLIKEYALTNPLELIGFGFTVCSIWLNTKQNPWGWIVGIVGIACYIYISLSVRLWGSFLLNIYFLIVSIYGWYLWKFGKKEEKLLAISRCTSNEIKILLLIVLALTFSLIGLLYSYQRATPIQYWDAEATAFSLVGQWLLARKKIENWIIWLFVNVQYVLIYFYQHLIVTSMLYVILIVLAAKGWKEWQKSMKKI